MAALGTDTGTPRPWGWWTRHKLEILEDYLQAFVTATKNLAKVRIYLDLFAGRPDNVDRLTGERLLGSVHRALGVDPPFSRIALFELEPIAKQLAAALDAHYPRDQHIRIYAGDCNEQIGRALADLRRVNWAPTFAFIDQQAAEVHWSTLEQIATFRPRHLTKAEMWILFGTSFLPRGLQWNQPLMDAQFGDRMSDLYGTEDWMQIVRGIREGQLDSIAGRYELVNLMRWRLEHVLGYRRTHVFTMLNTNGRELYDMIFATDHEAGDRIMSHLYSKAAERHDQMRRQALAHRRERRLAEKYGQDALLDLDPSWIRTGDEPVSGRAYVHEPPTEPFKHRP